MADTAAIRNWLRFRLRTLFIACFLAAVGLWAYRWIQWPARTLKAFNGLVEQKRYEEAAARLEYAHGYLVSPDDLLHRVHVAHEVCNAYCLPQPRSMADIVYGRQVYKVVGDTACFVDTGGVQAHFLIESMTLERGTIRYQWRGPMPRHNLRWHNGEWVRDRSPFIRWHSKEL
jgi:hypothetical protein